MTYFSYDARIPDQGVYHAISWREQVKFQGNDDLYKVRFLLDQHA